MGLGTEVKKMRTVFHLFNFRFTYYKVMRLEEPVSKPPVVFHLVNLQANKQLRKGDLPGNGQPSMKILRIHAIWSYMMAPEKSTDVGVSLIMTDDECCHLDLI